MSRPAKTLAKIAAFAAAGFAIYDTIAVPYGGIVAVIPAALYFLAAFALIWISDRVIRRFPKP